MIQTRFGLAKMQIAHAQLAKCMVVRYWCVQPDVLYGRE